MIRCDLNNKKRKRDADMEVTQDNKQARVTNDGDEALISQLAAHTGMNLERTHDEEDKPTMIEDIAEEENDTDPSRYPWDQVTEIAQKAALSMEDADILAEVFNVIVDNVEADEFFADDDEIADLQKLIHLVVKTTRFGLECGGGMGQPLAPEYAAAARSLCALLVHLARSKDNACNRMAPMRRDAIKFAQHIVYFGPYDEKSNTEAACAVYWASYHLTAHSDARAAAYQEEELNGIESMIRGMGRYTLSSFHCPADKIPIPVIVRGRWPDCYISNIELTLPMYAGLCAVLATFEGHYKDREALKMFIRAGGVQKVLETVMIFGHGLEQLHDAGNLEVDPSEILPQALKLVQAALALKPDPAHGDDEFWDEEYGHGSICKITEALVAQLMQIAADVHIDFNIHLFVAKSFKTVPSVQHAALAMLTSCVPEVMWQTLLRGFGCTAATSFVSWLTNEVGTAPQIDRSETVAMRTQFLVRVLRAGRVRLQVPSELHTDLQQCVNPSTDHQALLSLMELNTDIKQLRCVDS
jgi:hypothetical protein